jgi:hypothetical protein
MMQARPGADLVLNVDGREWSWEPGIGEDIRGAHPGFRSMDEEREFVCFSCDPRKAAELVDLAFALWMGQRSVAHEPGQDQLAHSVEVADA